MIRSATTMLASSAAGGALVAIIYSPGDGLFTAVLLAAIGTLVLAAAHSIGMQRSRFGGLASQARIAVAMAITSTLLAVWVGAALMFVSSHDAIVISVMAGAIGLTAMRVGEVLSRGAVGDARRLRDFLTGVGGGDRDVESGIEARDELGEVASAADSMVRRLSREEQLRADADAARRNLVATVSHDLRTPLASLRLLVESVQDGVVSGEMREEYLAQMRSHVNQLGALIDDLFELSRIQAGDIKWAMEKVELDVLLEDTVESMRAHARSRGVRVLAESADSSCVAHANPEKVQRVLFNLIQNAIRHTPSDGSVTVRARSLTDEVEIEVLDDGDGVAESDRDRLFEPFFRGGSNSEHGSDGAGLGLAIARAIVEAHGGRIWLEPSRTGTRMRFTLRSPGPEIAAGEQRAG